MCAIILNKSVKLLGNKSQNSPFATTYAAMLEEIPTLNISDSNHPTFRSKIEMLNMVLLGMQEGYQCWMCKAEAGTAETRSRISMRMVLPPPTHQSLVKRMHIFCPSLFS